MLAATLAIAFLVCAPSAPGHTAHQRTRVVSADSASIVSPACYSVLAGSSAVLTVAPKCPVRGVELHVTTYPSRTETLACNPAPPFSATWNYPGVPDHDQLSLHFGYTLYHTNGDTIVPPPQVHRWVIDNERGSSRRKAVCRQLSLKREISIDGSGDDWCGIKRNPIGKQGSFSCTWTPAAFYILLRVRDINITAGDRIELHVDLRMKRGLFAGLEHRLLSFAPAGRSFATVAELKGPGPVQADSIIVRIADEVEWRSSTSPEGYIIEARIPFCVLSDLEFPPKRMGFDAAVLDHGERADSSLSVVTWSGAAAANRHSPGQWGTLVLTQVMLPLKITLLSLLAAISMLILGALVLTARQKQQDRRFLKSSRHAYSAPVMKALDGIERRCHEQHLSLDDIAGEIGQDAAQLSRRFHHEVGADFNRLLSLSRVRMARRLLRSTEEAVEAIARRCGFADEQSFAATFTRIAGVSPKKYREIQKMEAQEEQETEDT